MSRLPAPQAQRISNPMRRIRGFSPRGEWAPGPTSFSGRRGKCRRLARHRRRVGIAGCWHRLRKLRPFQHDMAGIRKTGKARESKAPTSRTRSTSHRRTACNATTPPPRRTSATTSRLPIPSVQPRRAKASTTSRARPTKARGGTGDSHLRPERALHPVPGGRQRNLGHRDVPRDPRWRLLGELDSGSPTGICPPDPAVNSYAVRSRRPAPRAKHKT